MISALYVSTDGPYPKLLDDWWDEKRNAKLYDGTGPVIAHPPCAPWGSFRFVQKKHDPTCGPIAVEQVRKFGGVLEHPRGSKLWEHCGLPRPCEPDDAFGGFTVSVKQVSWGHCSVKPTWLYFCKVDKQKVFDTIKTGGTPTRSCGFNPSKQPKYAGRLPRATPLEMLATPLDFAKWLIEMVTPCP